MLKDSRKWFVLLATSIMIMLANLDMTITNVALAHITDNLHASINQAQWIITSYLLATVLFFTIFGKLADIYGRKRIFMIGIFLFTCGSLLAALSTNIYMLFISRFIQGLGFGATLGLSFVVILNNFPEQQRGFVAGIGVVISGISQAIGPTIGGIIVESLDWHWVFWINIPLGVLSFFMTYFVTPLDIPNAAFKSIGFVNILSFIFGFSLVLFAINEATQLSVYYLIFFVILGVFSFLIFALSSRRGVNPLIDIEILTHKNYLLITLSRFLFMIFFSGTLFIVPLYLQNILGYSPRNTGFALLCMTFFVAIVSPIAGKLMDKIGFSFPLLLSIILAVLAALTGMLIAQNEYELPLYLTLILLGIAIGLHVPSSIAGVYITISSDKAGTARGAFFTMALTGSTVGVALATTLLNKVSQHFIMKNFNYTNFNPKFFLAASGARSLAILPLTFQDIAKQVFMQAFHGFMMSITGLMFIALIFAINFFRKYKNELRRLP
jgi:DHA2 family methylenomycin A resistance protein-like MFS transporter